MGDSSGEQKGLEDMVDIRGVPPPDSSLVCSSKKAIKQRSQEVCMHE